MSSAFEKVASTAYGVAELRAYSDIPYAAATLRFIEEAVPLEQRITYPTTQAPQLEARQKLIDKLVTEVGGHQMLELASGLSTRGLVLTTADPTLAYVEIDLAGMVHAKQELLNQLLHGKQPPTNLHLIAGSVLDAAVFSEADTYLSPGPVTVINEGLLRYLTFDEKAQVAANIKTLLQTHGGYWITPDITLAAGLQQEAQQAPGQQEAIDTLLGQTISSNSFASVDAAKEFFEEQGYRVAIHPFSEALPQLTSPKNLGLSEIETMAVLEHCAVFVMQLKD